MAYMAPHRKRVDDSKVDLVFLKEKGVGLMNVVQALTAADHGDVMGYAIEVREGSHTDGYLIHVPFSFQESVDRFFKAQGEEK